MPPTRSEALAFLETQWSAKNNNKINGIQAEVRLKKYLEAKKYHVVSGGLLAIPGNPTKATIPTHVKTCVLPRSHGFSWSGATGRKELTPADLSAYNYFRQTGITAYFAEAQNVDEGAFERPSKRSGKTPAKYPRSYELNLYDISPDGSLGLVPIDEAFAQYPRRSKNKGLRCNATGRLNRAVVPWSSPEVVTQLFWFEYTRYYFHVDFLVSNNDLDLFVIGKSGTPYPVELKSKSPYSDKALGEWFGIDIGPFAKLSFFTANMLKNDALFVVEEVDATKAHMEWYGIRFTDLVKACSWVGQAGGKGMRGGASATYKVPKAAFATLTDLLPEL